MLWQHVVLCKSYAAENAPDYGCVSCVMLRETGYIFLIFVYSQFSTRFEKISAHHQESRLYQYDLRYMSLYVCDRVVCNQYINTTRDFRKILKISNLIKTGPIGAELFHADRRTGMTQRTVASNQTSIPHGHIHTVTHTRGRIDTTDSPGDEHFVARNM